MKDLAMSPTAPPPPPAATDSDELLGSLTTLQQQRTSARVIKKLRLEPAAEAKRDTPDCDLPTKAEDKDKFPTVKQRMPKALWSTDEKNLFFEALNEYGKDFDSITSYICSKMKKKGMPDANLKTKTQVSHFYYRTWHKLSKHVHFDENVKKVAQELYALINYGELRKKLVSVNPKIYSRLGEMVLGGSIMVRARGKNIRVRTPMCQALRKLNHMCERACGTRVWSRACCVLRARDAAAWTRVQAAAHNPRTSVSLPLRTSLKHLIEALSRRWMGNAASKKLRFEKIEDVQIIDGDENRSATTRGKDDLEEHLHLETDRIIAQELKLPKRPVLHLGPRPDAEIHLPVISPSEQLSSQKICFSSYLERVRDKDSGHTTKIRTSKRQRKDSTTDKDKEVEPKKLKSEDSEPPKIIDIDDTAVDGIELMANFKVNQDDDDKPSDGIDGPDDLGDDDVEREPDRDKDLSEKEKDSYSEMEDDEKYTKSDSDNESDHGKEDKCPRERNNLKVKFRLHTKKHGGTNYTLITDKDQDEKVEDLKADDIKAEELKEEEPKPEIDIDLATRQIRNGWSVYDAGELTVGDLYLMFGAGSKLELDYWWAEPTPPLPQPVHKSKFESEKSPPIDKEKQAEKKSDKSPEKVCEAMEEENRRESDTDIFSPKNVFGQDSNDGMSGDERKTEHNLLSSPEHKSCSSLLKLTSKLVNRPVQPPTQKPFSEIADRLKRLLALAGNPHFTSTSTSTRTKCNCGHVCGQPQKGQEATTILPNVEPVIEPVPTDVFRHPAPLAPRPTIENPKPFTLDGVPKWRRGRPPLTDKRVVVQRLLPLLPKLPTPNSLSPVNVKLKASPNLPRLAPKPAPTGTSNDSSSPMFYVLSESNGQFYFHDGDHKFPINVKQHQQLAADDVASSEEQPNESEEQRSTEQAEQSKEEQNKTDTDPTKSSTADIANFLPSESMSLSPSRLLRESDAWLEGTVQDFSLSSFLGHLEGRPQTDLGVDSHLQSLITESSVDYVAKFADLAAEVTEEQDNLPAAP